MEVLVLLLLLSVVIIYAVIQNVVQERKKKKRFLEHLTKQYGQFSDREYAQEDMIKAARMFLHQDTAFALDDITWNDLDLDQIYQMMNTTQSSAGDEMLYKILRCPELKDAEVLEQRERDITYFMEQPQERVRMQLLLHELGDSGRFSLMDYLTYLETLGARSNAMHFFAIFALLGSFALLFVQSTLGIACLAGVFCYNMVTYLKDKNQVSPYLTSFSYIMRMIDCAEQISKEPLQGVPEYRRSITAKKDKLLVLKKGSMIVFQMNSSSGNPMAIVFDYVKMLTHIDIILFNRMLSLVKKNQQEIIELAADIGYLDAVIAIGSFRKALPVSCVPKLVKGRQTVFAIEEGYHPALRDPVTNSFSQTRGMLVTGSNASGKSTFLKMTAINAVLAQTIHTCAAKQYEGGYYKLYSSMALRDNLSGGESYYIVEIKSLKRILDAVNQSIQEQDNPILCFVDEVLRGTNTVERIAASTQILKQLSQEGIFCFAATHDIELTQLLETFYDNYHFEEEVSKGDVLFSYRLLEGSARTRNAIKLLEVIGFSEQITQEAEKIAEAFLNTGVWSNAVGE